MNNLLIVLLFSCTDQLDPAGMMGLDICCEEQGIFILATRGYKASVWFP